VTRTALIIDCDPGVDDAIALLLAFACPEAFDILAITTVGGNVPAEATARNARIVRQMAGREDVPVHVGAAQPLVRPPVGAGHFHGESGLGSLPIFEPTAPAAPGDAASAIVEQVMRRPAGSVSLAVTGPMTNLALAIRREPRLAAHLGPVAIMGGARSAGGNITASAEFNIHADPDAADMVFRSDCHPVVLGLDATHQVRAAPERVAALARIDTPSARAVTELLRFCVRTQRSLVGWNDPPLHDPCTIAWLLQPELFETVPAEVQVETGSPLTLGHTAVELRVSERRPANARWAVKADGEGVFALLTDRLARA
jgi:purine nucleosidase